MRDIQMNFSKNKTIPKSEPSWEAEAVLSLECGLEVEGGAGGWGKLIP